MAVDNSIRPLVEGDIPQNGDVLVFNSALDGWVPGTAGGSSIAGDSQVQSSDHLANGGTNTCIRHFGTSVETIGTAITMALDADLGDSYTITEDGIYSIAYSDQSGGTGWLMGISKNATGGDLTTSIQGLLPEQILAIVNPRADDQTWEISWTGRLSAGDVIRPHCSGSDGPQSGSHTRSHWSMCQIIKL
jgi:hypothetical protein